MIGFQACFEEEEAMMALQTCFEEENMALQTCFEELASKHVPLQTCFE